VKDKVFCKEIDGAFFWFKNGKLHKEDGPAIIGNGFEKWFKEKGGKKYYG
jgi:hypothetical protein